MAFFVVERDSVDSSLRLPLNEAFPTREAAIAALSAATASGQVVLKHEVFIADLGAAVPVLVMPQVASSGAADVAPAAEVPVVQAVAEAIAEEPDVSEEPAVPEEPVEAAAFITAGEASDAVDAAPVAAPAEILTGAADEPFASSGLAEGVGEDEMPLAAALKRATSSLEDEGIVAPASIEAAVDEHEAEAEPEVEPEEAELPDRAASVAEPRGVAADEPETPAWPWANVESYEITDPSLVEPDADQEAAEDLAEEAELGEESVDSASTLEGTAEEPEQPETDVTTELDDLIAGLEAPSSAESPIITGAPAEGEDAYLPKPVILGDYADAPDAAEPVAALEEPVIAAAASDEATEIVEAAVEPIPEAALEGEDAIAAPLEGGYESKGDLDLASYSCQDCVYSNTCPKVGEVVPADCGSFQWISQ